MSLIKSVDLTKRFGDHMAVDHVSLSVERGEVVGFLGPNGAGKSTSMRMIAGFLEPDEGTAAICGHDVWGDPIAAKRHLGYLPEGAPAYADMTVGDFLTFVARIRGLAPAERNNRLAEMVARINIADVWSKPIENLSKGFKRRVGIAQALIHDPDVLILDEPTDGLDPNQKHEMRTLIRAIAPDKAIVVSTHILEEVEAICTRAVIIAQGQVVADETPDELLMRGTPNQTLRVAVAATDTAELISKVTPLAHGGRVEVLDRTKGITRLLVSVGANGAAPDAEALKRDIAGLGLTVEDVSPHQPRLDDVFRQITQPAAAPGDGPPTT